MPVRKIKGSWWVDITWQYQRFRKRSPLNTRAGAMEYEITIRRELAETGSLITAADRRARTTLAAFAQTWIETYVVNNNRLSEQRGKEAAFRLHLLPHLGTLPLEDIRRADIERFKTSKREEGLCAKTINNHLTILRSCLKAACADGLITALPPIQNLQAEPVEFTYLSVEESMKLLSDRTEPFWTDLARLALRTGMRRGELIALDWSAVDLASARITVNQSCLNGVFNPPKNNRIRHLPLTRDVVEILSSRSARRGLVFPRRDGGPLSIGVMREGLRRLCRRTGTRHIGWHALRHTFASQLASEGVSIAIVKELMGHSDIQMTMRYAHLAPSALASAVPVLLQAEERVRQDSRQPVVNRALLGPSSTPSVELRSSSFLAQPNEKRPCTEASS